MKFKIKIKKIKEPPIHIDPHYNWNDIISYQEYAKEEAYRKHMQMVKMTDLDNALRRGGIGIGISRVGSINSATSKIVPQDNKKYWFSGLNIFKKNKK